MSESYAVDYPEHSERGTMARMTAEWTPADDETTRVFARYKQAKETERKLKPTMRDLAVEELKRGATPAQLADLTGESAEVLRRLREQHGIAVDPRYASRAELARARKKATPAAAPSDSGSGE